MRTWSHVTRSAVMGFQRHAVTNLAAGLTYYAMLAIFPGLLAVVALLGVFADASTVDSLLDLLRDLGQRDVADQLEDPIRQMVDNQAAGPALVIGLAGATWSATGYVNGFGRAINRVYEVDEGRPFWKLRPLQLAITAVLIVLTVVVLTGLVISGPLAREIGDRLGYGDATVRAWEIGKYPVLLVIVMGIVALLYSLTPNVQRRIRPLSVGAVLAIGVWVLASIGFRTYVTNFASYNSTYGSLAGVIIFLLWLWLTNLALLFGAEVDAEIERVRQLEAGQPAERTLQLGLRDDHTLDARATKLDALVAERREMRQAALTRQARAAAGAARSEQAESMGTAAQVPAMPRATSGVPDPTLSTVKVLGQVAAVGILAAVVSALTSVFGSSDRS